MGALYALLRRKSYNERLLSECHLEPPAGQCLLMPVPLAGTEASAQQHEHLGGQDVQSMIDVGNLLRLNSADQMKDEREG